MISKNRKYASLKEWLDRGIVNVYPSKTEFEKALESKKKITIYHGVDATGAKLHLGHSTNFFILRKIQEFGHKIIFLIGDFTAMIGDPTDKSSTRQPLDNQQVLDNCKTYKKQASKILNFSGKNPVKIMFNSAWLSKITLSEIIKIASHVTVQQMLSRDMFQERLKAEKNIALHEFIYPLLQGYDSVAMKVDAELGGNDQTFNMLVGRDLCKKILGKDKFVITTKLLENPKTGKKLMSKSEGSYVGLDDTPKEMFGKIMSMPDEVIINCLSLCTDLPNDQIKQIKKQLDDGENPKNIKIKLAQEIISIYHTLEDAHQAEAEFNRIFKDKEIPDDIKTIDGKKYNGKTIVEILFEAGLVNSKGQARRLVEQGGVKIDKAKIGETNEQIFIHDGMVIQYGRRNFIKLRLK